MASQTIEHLIDIPALQRFVNENVPGQAGPIEVEKHVAGFSNETFYVTRGNERWVLRRPPAGPLLPTAHDVLREHRFLAALHGKARVPRPVAVCDDSSVIGAPFYLMERAEGIVIRDAIPAAYDTPEGRRHIAEEMIDSLVEMHAVDWKASGIKGHEGGYLARQLDRWSSQWALTKPRTRELAGLDALTEWLKSKLPDEGPSAVVHGDYKLDNVMFDASEPRLIAIFDWEMATVGDPLADLGYLMNSWSPVASPPPGTPVPVHQRPGFPTAQEMADRYEARSGRSMSSFLFYRVLAQYKLIVILEGLYMHYLEGAASNPGAAEFKVRVPMMIDNAQRLIAAEDR
ncbi:MAG: phosphotransferase family protein [Tepidiformaceae bacterium]